MKYLAQLKKFLFEKPTPRELAVSALEETKRQLIKSIAAAEYHKRMVDYNYALITELEEQVKANGSKP